MDLTADYLGLELKSPLVVSSTPLSKSVDNIMRMEAAGAGAVILPSLFEEQLTLDASALEQDLARGSESYAESLSYLPAQQDIYHYTQAAYVAHLQAAKRNVSIPVIASLNGASPGGWTHFARELEAAGADALELNTYSLATDPTIPSGEVEQGLIDLVAQVKRSVTIPVAVKLSPQFTTIPYLARQLEAAGADALVLFNRFYQPDFDIDKLEVVPRIIFSSREELLLRLHWVAILYGNTNCDLAITGGVHTAECVLKSIMAGAQVAMMTSALHLNGIGWIADVQSDLIRWMEEHEYHSIRQMRGSLSRRSVPDTTPFDRGNYIKTLSSYTLRPGMPHS